LKHLSSKVRVRALPPYGLVNETVASVPQPLIVRLNRPL
jgi:hypothetical protein